MVYEPVVGVVPPNEIAVPLFPKILSFITTVFDILSQLIAVRELLNSLFVIEIFPPLE